MAPPAKRAGAPTPPRRNKKTETQFFEPGKRGRKTGLVLKDTGIRDEHGLEPMSGIFSSPVIVPPNEDQTLASSVVDAQGNAEETIPFRKTPRLPPAKQSTPRHTNIGSPKRMSSTRPTSRGLSAMESQQSPARTATHPRANRVLEFAGDANRNRKSIAVVEDPSPFRPKKVLRRSDVAVQQHHAPVPTPRVTDSQPTEYLVNLTNGEGDDSDDDVEQSIEVDPPLDDEPIMMDDEMSYAHQPDQTDLLVEEAQETVALSSPSNRLRRSQRTSLTEASAVGPQHTPPTAAMLSPTSKKRKWRSSEVSQIIDDPHVSLVEGSQSGSAQKKRGRPSYASQMDVHRDEPTIDPALLAQDDGYILDAPDDSPVEQPLPEKKTKGKKAAKSRAAAPKERDPNRVMEGRQSTSKSPSKTNKRGGSTGPVSNVNLRATTPFEDAGQQTSRYGRNLIQPLKYWENEARIWKHGAVEGIIRAEPVDQPSARGGKKKRKGKKRALGITQLEDIDEESEPESVMPDEWEENVGVLTGQVANWNPATNTADSEELVDQDLAFAKSAIKMRPVQGADFKYAKIMTIPFFGAGVVEIPPEGSKRSKNSHKMHMVFFVHDGKVMVEVGAGAEEYNQFALSKGGVWVVPRGNNYAITNESRTRAAKVFFAQGCVVNAESE